MENLRTGKTELGLLPFNDLNRFKNFIKNHWDKNHIFVVDSIVFNWQHKGATNYHYLIAKSDGEIIGAHGVIPLNHFDQKLTNNQIFIALWRVLENRGIGIGLRIFQEILKIYNPTFIAGLPMNSKVTKFYNRFGFECKTMSHHVMLSQEKKNFFVAHVPENISTKGSFFACDANIKKLCSDSLKKIDSEHLYNYQTPIKSDDYIINRYLNHPVYKYFVYSITVNSSVKILAVVRPIHINGNTICTIVDYIGSNDDFPLLSVLMRDLLKRYNAEFVDIYSYGIPDNIISKSGFLNVKEISDLIIPGLFEPFVKKNVDIICGFYNNGNDSPVRIFKGDSDADRPSKIEKLGQ